MLWNSPWSHEEEYLKTAVNPKDDDQPGRVSAYLNYDLGTISQNLEQKRKKKTKRFLIFFTLFFIFILFFFLSLRDFKPPQTDKKCHFDS